jgi:hypothetical protein
MGEVEEIEIRAVFPEELAGFRKRFPGVDAEAWDREMETDARASKLDALAEAAL